jgi:2-hydroxy-3-keto-5-methylthiopentenyl-1-phosphate phosphatase
LRAARRRAITCDLARSRDDDRPPRLRRHDQRPRRRRSQLACLPRDPELLRRVAAEVAIDPGVEPLVEALVRADAEVMVVSDGFGFYIADALAPLAVPTLTNCVDFAAWQMRFAELPADCPCRACGTCKRAPALDARARGRTVILVGDGTSDRHAAAVADVVFAKAALAAHCEAKGIAFVPFETLGDVRRALVGPAGE